MPRVEIDDIEYVTETDSAILFWTSDGREVWLPKSQCDWDPEEGVALVEEWLAQKEGLI